MKAVPFLLLLVGLIPSAIHAEGVVEKWVTRYDGPSNGFDYARAVAVDSVGNVIVTGYSVATGSSEDYYTAKYAAADGALLWERRYNGPGNGGDYASAIAVDSAGNAIVTGQSIGSSGNYDYYTAKYAVADGALLWERRYNGPGNDEDSARAVMVDNAGNTIVTGFSVGDGTYRDYYTAKYAAADGSLLWEKRYSSPGHYGDLAFAVTLDAAGNVIVTGTSYADYYTLKYAAANGALIWENRYNGPNSTDDSPNAVAVDGAGNVLVTGYTIGSTGRDFCTIKCAAANGALVWDKIYDGLQSWDEGRTVVADSAGDVIITGYSNIGGVGINDCYTAKYAAADGALLWEKRYNGIGSISGEAFAMALDSAGNPVIAGFADRYGSGSDFFTAKLAGTTGTLLWEKFYGGQSNLTDQAAAVAVDGAGNVVVTGTFHNTFSSDRDYATVKYAPGPDLDTDSDGLLDSWEFAHFGTIAGHSALDDNDHDGRVELFELAFANNPNDALTGSGAPLFSLESGFLTVTITKQPGVTYLVEGSYTPHPADFSIRNTQVLLNNATTLKARHRIFGTPDDVPDSRFLRVKVLGAPY